MMFKTKFIYKMDHTEYHFQDKEQAEITKEDFTALHTLIRRGELHSMLCYINKRNIVNTTYRRCFRKEGFQDIPCPVAMAAESGQKDVMRALKSRLFSPREISHGFQPGHLCHPIHFACFMGHLDIVKSLIEEYNVEFTRGDSDYNTPLSLAVANSKLDVVEYLIGKGATFDDMDDLSSAVRLSVKMKNTELTKCLISLEGTVSVGGSTLLHDAASRGDHDVVSAILDIGARVDVTTATERETPFLTAAKYGHLAVMKLLHAKGADPNVCDSYGDTALHIATTFSLNDTVFYLVVDLNVSLGKKNKDGKTPFSVAVKMKNIPLIQLFVDAGFHPQQETWLWDAGDETYGLLMDVFSKPRSLREICSFNVRQRLGRRLPEVDCLPLPTALKKLVKLTHISMTVSAQV